MASEEQQRQRREGHGDEDNDERPHAHAAPALLSQDSTSASGTPAPPPPVHDGSTIPHLLSSGKFPSNSRRMSLSPPTLLSSPRRLREYADVVSPPLPAAPPSTPLLGAVASLPALNPPLPFGSLLSSSPNRYQASHHRPFTPPLHPVHGHSGPFASSPSPFASPRTAPHPPPPNVPPLSPGATLPAPDDARYHALLDAALRATAEREKARVAALVQHESENYAGAAEYRHALARERRHSHALALELTRLQCLTRHTSCHVHALAEITEEARVNALIKNIAAMKRDLREDQCRVVMELEREEERMINGLVGRLEEVTREKQLLERQIGCARGAHAAGGGSGRGGPMDVDEQMLHAQFERMMAERQQQEQGQHGTSNIVPSERMSVRMPSRQRESTHAAAGSTATAPTLIGSESSIKKEDGNNNSMMEEEEEEEEEDVDNADLLGGRCHDPEMEEELAKLLKREDPT